MATEANVPEPGGDEAETLRNAATLLGMITGNWVSQIVRAAADLSLADHVAQGPITAEEVAERESSDPRTTYRLMRACASLGLLTYVGERRFGGTGLSELLRTDAPVSLREMALTLGAHGHWQCWGLFPEAVRRGETQMPAALGVPDMFAYYARHPEEGELFAAAMTNVTSTMIEDAVALIDVPEHALIVDVGGANGTLVQALLLATPGTRGQVLDLPHVVPGALRAAEAAGLGDRFAAVAGDFFAEVPAADLYLLKTVLHDWDDESCVTILRNCRAAVRPGGRVAVVEMVIGEAGEPGFGPLADMNMLAVTRGRERELGEYDALFARSGWRRTRARPTRTPYWVLELEAV
jgi:hypothetical protein